MTLLVGLAAIAISNFTPVAISQVIFTAGFMTTIYGGITITKEVEDV